MIGVGGGTIGKNILNKHGHEKKVLAAGKGILLLLLLFKLRLEGCYYM